MQGIIDEVLRTEEKARKIVQEAKRKESELRSALETEINGKINDAKREAQKLMQNGFAEAEEKTRVEFKQAIQESEKKNHEFLNGSENHFDEIASRIVSVIVTPEHSRE